ncbi:hypothetical protein F6R98_10495 [Candidatus Methylospira mobilis]|uniref:Uncharacterized protein n=1 Tax=Candidatus Methylospira mobilis TaxID=1808979 RepID=A0A5Q0BLB1_9GAMM|nr:hypothetical protein [Candidatus Methylospira mobilis]QFY42991.1 hypothetical protein F6R98_10495 [Candidatus Methylospira mobilis]
MRLYSKDDLQDALFEALNSNKSSAEFVKKYVTNLGKIIKKRPQHYRYFGPYWWALKSIMLKYEVPGIDDFVDLEWLEKINQALTGDDYVCVASWAMQESRFGGLELPTNTVMLEDAEGNMTECVTIDPFLEALIKSG